MLYPIDKVMTIKPDQELVALTSSEINFLYKKLTDERKEHEKAIEKIQDVTFALQCLRYTKEDLEQHVKEELSSERNASSLSKNQNDEQSTSPETDRHLAIANG